MEDIFDRVGCPSAPLVKCTSAPIDKNELAAMVVGLRDEPAFRGVWTLAADGNPVAILHALDEKTFRAARSSITAVLVWNWPNNFGRQMSFSLVVPRGRRPRIFVPYDSALVHAVAECGRISFAVSIGGQVSPFYQADFTRHPEHAEMLEAFRTLLQIDDCERFVFRDDELAYWLLMSYPGANWQEDLPTRDAMRGNWAIAWQLLVELLVRSVSDIRSPGMIENAFASANVQSNLNAVMPWLGEIVEILIDPSTKVVDAIRFACTALSDPRKMGDWVHGLSVCFKEDVLADQLKWAARDLLWAALLSPSSTICGLRRPWLHGRNQSGDVSVRNIDLDPAALGEGARTYWTDFDFHEIFDVGYVVTGKDVPIPRIWLGRELSDLSLNSSEGEADDAIRELLAEARENRQWSAPWGARVQIDVGPLKYLDIYELEGEFIGLFRDLHERFIMISMNISTGHYSRPMILRSDENERSVEDNTQAELALALIVASVVRDFLVVEERHSHFSAKVAKQRRCPTNQDLSIIYIPRVRYLKPDVGAFHQAVGGDMHRAAHGVAPHLRKAEQASPAQLQLAKRYGFAVVPRGYTFVRPHRRGDAPTQERQRLYRSRSASAILYRSFAKVPPGSRPAWFDFEKDVAEALSRLGLRVVHQSASKRGDGGVDIYAYDQAEDRGWAVQCKCYAPARKIGPHVVRELAGSLHRYPEGTCGMVVTTSSFTPTALEEAAALKFKTIDGLQFAALANG